MIRKGGKAKPRTNRDRRATNATPRAGASVRPAIPAMMQGKVAISKAITSRAGHASKASKASIRMASLRSRVVSGSLG